jgi:hypothetical protein
MPQPVQRGDTVPGLPPELQPRLTFDEFLERFPGLLDGGLVERHFSAELLATPAARATWVDPDLRPLPAHT